jgi:CheY-like chemotaxis protein
MTQIPQQSRFTVLLADDNAGWCPTVRTLLEPQGVHSVVARSGREALSLLETQQIHLAVLDHSMPQLGGLQIVRMMRQMQSRIPAILLTHQLSNQLLQEALGVNVFSVIAKPVDFNQLLQSMAGVMRRHYADRWPH